MISSKRILEMAMPFGKMLAILIVGHFVVVYLLRFVRKAVEKSKIDKSLGLFFVKAVNIILHIFIVLSALSAIGISTSGIIAAFSAAAVAVSLALKDSLGNVAGGILLLISPRFVTGDYIAAGGKEGTVLSVDLLHTKIRTVDGKLVNIPNGVLINEYIVNYSAEEKRRVELLFPIPYDADVNSAKRAALDVMDNNSMVLIEPEKPFARVDSYGDSAVNLLVRAWCETKNYWTVRFDLNEQIREKLEENGIEIPFNQLDVNIKKVSD